MVNCMSTKCHHCGVYCDLETHECEDAPTEAECTECGDICSAADELCPICDAKACENYQQSVEDSYMTAIRGF